MSGSTWVRGLVFVDYEMSPEVQGGADRDERVVDEFIEVVADVLNVDPHFHMYEYVRPTGGDASPDQRQRRLQLVDLALLYLEMEVHDGLVLTPGQQAELLRLGTGPDERSSWRPFRYPRS